MSTTAYSIEKQEKYTEIAILEDKFTARIAPELKTELVVLRMQVLRT